MRTWKIGGSVLTAVLLVMGVVQTVVEVAHDDYTETESYDAAGIDVIEVDNQADRVLVTGTDGDTVTVTAEISDGLQDTRHSRRIDGRRLLLDASCPVLTNFCGVTYTIETPPETDLVVRSTSRVEVTGISGDVDIEAGESVEAADLGGTVRLHSRHHSVEATGLSAPSVEVSSDRRAHLVFVDAPDHVDVRTRYSSVEVIVPDDGGSYAIDADSSYGSVDTSAMRIDPESDRTIVAHGDRDVTVRYD